MKKAALAFALCLGVIGSAMAQTAVTSERADDATLAAKFSETHAAAERGDAVAQDNLGMMYRDGKGVARDYAQAITWFQKAADQGNASAQSDLGMMYLSGLGVERDEAQAVVWFRKAADQGNADGQYRIGLAYALGKGGVAPDYDQAEAWIRKAAEQGHAGAREMVRKIEASGSAK